MELESYIDRLNRTIEWLESEQLTVTDNIINLKVEYNELKAKYDHITKQMQEESDRYSTLLMQNVRMTYNQNQDIIDQIEEDKVKLHARSLEIAGKELELSNREKSISLLESEVSRTRLSLDEEAKRQEVQKKFLENRSFAYDTQERKIAEDARNNEENRKMAEYLLKRNEETKEHFDRLIAEAIRENELRDNDYRMKIQDLERREGLIDDEKTRIASEWRSIKHAKAHIDSLKQGNQ